MCPCVKFYANLYKGGKDHVFKGAEVGTSDIIACVGGRYVTIEVKMPGNKPTPDHQAFLNSVRNSGGIAIVAYNLDDVDAGLDWEPYR